MAIYVEGGGKSTDGKARLRQGLSAFFNPLRLRGGARRLRWSVIPCGGRDSAIEAFLDALENDPEVFNVLLVDSDEEVSSEPAEHLRLTKRASLDAAAVNLMVRTMETWIVADADALSRVYGKGFDPNKLPSTQDLESVDKSTIADALKRATKSTARGAYHKINHIRDLLAALDATKVRARCKHCERLFSAIEARITPA